MKPKTSMRQRQAVFLAASKALVSGHVARLSVFDALALCAALCVFDFNGLFVVAGLYLILFDIPNLIASLFGVLLLALAWLARPRRPAVPEISFGPSDLPNLFDFLDRLTRQMGAPGIDRVSFSAAWNASIQREAGTTYLNLGMPLLLCAPAGQRVAIIAHEVAHLQNHDLRRSGLFSRVFATLDAWLTIFGRHDRQETQTSVEGAAEVVRRSIIALLLGLRGVLLFATARSSQRAEYLADGLAGQVAGVEAARKALALAHAGRVAERVLVTFHATEADRGLCVLAEMAHAIDGMDETDWAGQAADMERALQRTDLWHPPTLYRIAFLDLVEKDLPVGAAAQADWSVIDQDLQAVYAAAGAELLRGRGFSEAWISVSVAPHGAPA